MIPVVIWTLLRFFEAPSPLSFYFLLCILLILNILESELFSLNLSTLLILRYCCYQVHREEPVWLILLATQGLSFEQYYDILYNYHYTIISFNFFTHKHNKSSLDSYAG